MSKSDFSSLFGMSRGFPTAKPAIEFYENKEAVPSQRWWWRLQYLGKIVAASSEGYANRADAVTNFKRIEEHIKYLRDNDLIK